MNRHPFRWTGAAFGAFFLAVAGSWAAGEQDLLTQREFGLGLSGILIVAGVLGVVATFWRPTPHETTSTIDTNIESQEDTHEALDPQP